MPPSRARLGALGVAALAALLPACQGGACLDSSTMLCSPIPPTPTPSRPPERLSQGTGALARDGVAVVSVTLAEAGSIFAVVDWTFAVNTVEVHIARGSCTASAFLDGRCEMIGSSANPAAKPKRMTVGPVPAGVYTLLVRNLGPGDESFAFDLTLAR